MAEGCGPMERARHTMEAAFEFFQKIGVDFSSFHDRDSASLVPQDVCRPTRKYGLGENRR
jgi:xylose isomerase